MTTDPTDNTEQPPSEQPRPGGFASLFIRHDVDGPRWRRPVMTGLGILVIVIVGLVTWFATAPDVPPAALTVTAAYVPPTNTDTADVYFTVSNTGAGPDTLTAAGAEYQTGTSAKNVTVCADDPCSGAATVDIKAQNVILFGPGGPHIEVTGLGPLTTKHQPLQLTLTFARSGTLHILAPVGGAQNLNMNDVMTYGFMGHSSPGMGDMSGTTGTRDTMTTMPGMNAQPTRH